MALNINGTTGISGVDGSVAAPAVTGTDSNTGITFPSADTIKFSTGGVERMAISNSGVSGITSGITMLDQWTLSSNYNVNGGESNLTANNWSRTSHALFGSIGSAMTVSSGVFTFPTTGIYVIIAAFTGKPQSSASTYVGMKIQGTSDSFSSSDVFMASNYDSCSSSSEYAHVSAVAVFDCTNTSTHKIRFRTEVQNDFQWSGGQGRGPTFIRVGDT